MSITKYTFFSPNGTEFPVSANADGKLYMMLSGLQLNSYRRKDWETPIDSSLNRQYVNTSLVVAGRYFELHNETVVLNPLATNYVHANIDLANTNNPVSITVESSDKSNSTDINNKSGVIKRVFDIVTTSSTNVTQSIAPEEVSKFGTVSLNKFQSDTNWANVTLGTGVNRPSGAFLRWRIKSGMLVIHASAVQTTIDTGGAKLLGTLPSQFKFESQYVGTAWTGNALYPWRIRLTNNNIYLQGQAGIRSDNITFLLTYPLD